MKRGFFQNLLHSVFQNCSKPVGVMGKLIIRMMNASHNPISQWGLSHVDFSPDATVIDLGCGGGKNVSALLEICPHGYVTGFDYSSVSVEMSKKKNAGAIRDGRCQIVEGDVASLPFPDESFDVATAFETIYFWPKGSFSNVYRILKSGGEFLIVCEADGSCPADEKWTHIIDGMQLHSCENIVRELENVGFSVVQTDRKPVICGEENWVCVLAKK